MTFPPGVTEEDFLAAVTEVGDLLARRFDFGRASSEEDVRQVVALHAVEALHRFRPEAGSLVGFLYTHCKYKLLSKQLKEVGRVKPPCMTCHRAALGVGPGHDDGRVCANYQKWRARRQAKSALARPVSHHVLPDESQARGGSEPEAVLIAAETEELIDRHLPPELRDDYARLREGDQLTSRRRHAVRLAVARILGLPYVGHRTRQASSC